MSRFTRTFSSAGAVMMLASFAVLAAEPLPAKTGKAGTTIIGEQESAIGLYLTPWKNDSAADMDLPPALLDDTAGNTPLSRIGTYDSVTEYQRERWHRQ